MSQIEKDTILIIEDEIEINNILSEFITELGYSTHQCTSGPQALDLILDRKINPVLIICDCHLPEMSGHDFIKFLLAKNMNLNICMITGDPTSESILEALKLGVSDYIRKPLSLTELREKIETLVDLGRNKHRLQEIRNRSPEFSKINQNENMLRVLNSNKKVDS